MLHMDFCCHIVKEPWNIGADNELASRIWDEYATTARLEPRRKLLVLVLRADTISLTSHRVDRTVEPTPSQSQFKCVPNPAIQIGIGQQSLVGQQICAILLP